MTKEELKVYIDTGFVPQYFLNEIVEGIKTGQRLNGRHLQVYISHGPIIEMMLRNKNI